MVDRLIGANSPSNPHYAVLTEFGVIEVAGRSGDYIVIGQQGRVRSGYVFRIAPDVDLEPRLGFTAKDFPDFLKAATEFDSYRAQRRSGSQVVTSHLEAIGEYIPDQAITEWRIFAKRR